MAIDERFDLQAQRARAHRMKADITTVPTFLRFPDLAGRTDTRHLKTESQLIQQPEIFSWRGTKLACTHSFPFLIVVIE